MTAWKEDFGLPDAKQRTYRDSNDVTRGVERQRSGTTEGTVRLEASLVGICRENSFFIICVDD